MSSFSGDRKAKYKGQEIAIWGGTASTYSDWQSTTEGDHVKWSIDEFAFPATIDDAYYMYHVGIDCGWFTEVQFQEFVTKYGKPYDFPLATFPDDRKLVQQRYWREGQESDPRAMMTMAKERRMAFTVLKQGVNTDKVDRKYFDMCYGSPAMLLAMLRFLASEVMTKGVDGLDLKQQFAVLKWPTKGSFVEQLTAFNKLMTMFTEMLSRHEEHYRISSVDKQVALRTLRPDALKACDRDMRMVKTYDDAYMIALSEARVIDKANGVTPVLVAGNVDVASFYVKETSKPKQEKGGKKQSFEKSKVDCLHCGGSHNLFNCDKPEIKAMSRSDKFKKLHEWRKSKEKKSSKTVAAGAAGVDEEEEESEDAKTGPKFTFNQTSGLYCPATGKENSSVNMYRYDRGPSSYVNALVFFPCGSQRVATATTSGSQEQMAEQSQRMEEAFAARNSAAWMQDCEFVDSGAGVALCDDKEKYRVYVDVQPGELPGFGGIGGSRRETVGHGIRDMQCWDPEAKCNWQFSFYSRATEGAGDSIVLISEDSLAQSMVGCSTIPTGEGQSVKRLIDYSDESKMRVQMIKTNSIWAMPKSTSEQLQQHPIKHAGNDNYAMRMLNTSVLPAMEVLISPQLPWYASKTGLAPNRSESAAGVAHEDGDRGGAATFEGVEVDQPMLVAQQHELLADEEFQHGRSDLAAVFVGAQRPTTAAKEAYLRLQSSAAGGEPIPRQFLQIHRLLHHMNEKDASKLMTMLGMPLGRETSRYLRKVRDHWECLNCVTTRSKSQRRDQPVTAAPRAQIQPGGEVAADLYGPCPTSVQGNVYASGFVDLVHKAPFYVGQASKHSAMTRQAFNEFCRLRDISAAGIKRVHTDGGTEYGGKGPGDFATLMLELRIEHVVGDPYPVTKNVELGLIEGCHAIVQARVRAILFDGKRVIIFFGFEVNAMWEYALASACALIEWMPVGLKDGRVVVPVFERLGLTLTQAGGLKLFGNFFPAPLFVKCAVLRRSVTKSVNNDKQLKDRSIQAIYVGRETSRQGRYIAIAQNKHVYKTSQITFENEVAHDVREFFDEPAPERDGPEADEEYWFDFSTKDVQGGAGDQDPAPIQSTEPEEQLQAEEVPAVDPVEITEVEFKDWAGDVIKIGQKLTVYWPAEKKAYTGAVIDICHEDETVQIRYAEDDAVMWYSRKHVQAMFNRGVTASESNQADLLTKALPKRSMRSTEEKTATGHDDADDAENAMVARVVVESVGDPGGQVLERDAVTVVQLYENHLKHVATPQQAAAVLQHNQQHPDDLRQTYSTDLKQFVQHQAPNFPTHSTEQLEKRVTELVQRGLTSVLMASVVGPDDTPLKQVIQGCVELPIGSLSIQTLIAMAPMEAEAFMAARAAVFCKDHDDDAEKKKLGRDDAEQVHSSWAATDGPSLKGLTSSSGIPKFNRIEEGMNHPEYGAYVRHAVAIEMNQKQAMKTYREVLVEQYPGKRLHSMNGTLSIKYNRDNTVARFKYRFYVSGFWDQQGRDYQGSPWSAMPSTSAIKLVEAVGVQLGLYFFKTDVVCCFNQSRKLDRLVVCRLPKGIRTTKDGKEIAWLLLVALNGLPEATREWQVTFEEWLLKDLRDRSGKETERRRALKLNQTRFHFIRSDYEEALYVCRLNTGQFYLTRIVDDISGYVTEESCWYDFRELYAARFKITGGEEPFTDGMYNGAHVKYDRENGVLEYRLSGSIERLLQSMGSEFADSIKLSGVPMIANAHNTITRADCPGAAEDVRICDSFRAKYRTVVMTVLWMVNYVPEVAFAVSFLSRFLQNPGVKMWGAVKVLLGYLKGRIDRPLVYRRTPGTTSMLLRAHLPRQQQLELSTSADASHSDNEDGTATIGYFLKLNDCVIVGKTQKLKRITIGTNESELYGQTECGRHMLNFRYLLQELGHAQQGPTVMFCDSKGAVAVAERRAPTHRTSHIQRRMLFIRQLVQEEEAKLVWISTSLMEADILTKALPGPQFKMIRDRLLNGLPLRE